MEKSEVPMDTYASRPAPETGSGVDIEYRTWTPAEVKYTCAFCKNAFNTDSLVAEAPNKELYHAACMRQLLSDPSNDFIMTVKT